MMEDEMVGWHHQINGHEFEQLLGLVMDRKTPGNPLYVKKHYNKYIYLA